MTVWLLHSLCVCAAVHVHQVSRSPYEQYTQTHLCCHSLYTYTQGEEPSKPPPFPDLKPQVIMGAWGGVREVAVRFVRRIYEHLAVWRLGAARASPFLRDGVLWVHHVRIACLAPLCSPFCCVLLWSGCSEVPDR